MSENTGKKLFEKNPVWSPNSWFRSAHNYQPMRKKRLVEVNLINNFSINCLESCNNSNGTIDTRRCLQLVKFMWSLPSKLLQHKSDTSSDRFFDPSLVIHLVKFSFVSSLRRRFIVVVHSADQRNYLWNSIAKWQGIMERVRQRHSGKLRGLKSELFHHYYASRLSTGLNCSFKDEFEFEYFRKKI